MSTTPKNGRKPKAEQQKSAITFLPVEQLQPNEYNPNRMATEEFQELLAEVRHLSRLPKPVIVRCRGDVYTIVDGEHGWRAAREVGLAEVPCEVIDADDFEAMRQTYKRNQHGTHDPVLLGRMFQSMMQTRSLSARALAREIAVSEGTVRNAVLYAEADKVRNSYARKGDAEISRLSVRQVRCFTALPTAVANLWLDCRADLKVLFRVKEEWQLEQAAGSGEFEWLGEKYSRLQETGLFEYVGTIRTPEGFDGAVKKVQAWHSFERTWLRHGIDAQQLRGFTRHHFKSCFFVHEQRWMEIVLEQIIDTSQRPPQFLLTAEEFDILIQETGRERSSFSDFMDRLRLAIVTKTGKQPRKDNRSVKQELLQQTLKEAPDYIRDGSLPPEQKYALWKTEAPEGLKRELARKDRLPLEDRERGKDRGYEWCIQRLTKRWADHLEFATLWSEKTEMQLAADLAKVIVESVYDPKVATLVPATTDLINKLSALTKEELIFLWSCAEHRVRWRGWYPDVFQKLRQGFAPK
jgi:ParB/RepB/Spo0J family partition protein